MSGEMKTKKTVKLTASWDVDEENKIDVNLTVVCPGVLSNQTVVELHTLLEGHLEEIEAHLDGMGGRRQPSLDGVQRAARDLVGTVRGGIDSMTISANGESTTITREDAEAFSNA